MRTTDALIDRAKCSIWALASAEATGQIEAGFTARLLRLYADAIEAQTMFEEAKP